MIVDFDAAAFESKVLFARANAIKQDFIIW